MSEEPLNRKDDVEEDFNETGDKIRLALNP